MFYSTLSFLLLLPSFLNAGEAALRCTDEAMCDQTGEILHCPGTIYQAIAHGDLPLTQHFVRAGTNINKLNSKGLTPLHYAVAYNQTTIMLFLLAHKAYINSGEFTPLHVSAYYNNWQIAQTLLTMGAPIDQPTRTGVTPLYQAAQQGNREMVLFLLDARAHVNAATVSLCQPLHAATFHKHYAIVQDLLTYGANVNGRMINRLCPLHLAVQNNDIRMMEILLQAGAQPNCCVESQPLHIAGENGYLDCAALLITWGALVDVPNKDGYTPAQLAESRGYTRVANFLRTYVEIEEEEQAADLLPQLTDMHQDDLQGSPILLTPVNSFFYAGDDESWFNDPVLDNSESSLGLPCANDSADIPSLSIWSGLAP